jgi:hypothetical protein
MVQMPVYGGQAGAMMQPFPQAFPAMPALDPRIFGGMVPTMPR